MQRSVDSQFVEEIAKKMYIKNLRALHVEKYENVKKYLKKNKEIEPVSKRCVNVILSYARKMNNDGP